VVPVEVTRLVVVTVVALVVVVVALVVVVEPLVVVVVVVAGFEPDTAKADCKMGTYALYATPAVGSRPYM
jgi:hypothetical protein